MAGQRDHEILVALKHPTRREILRTLVEETRLSPREISERLDLPLSNVSYHVRVLADQGVVTLVGQAQVRGSVQHFYRLELDEEWALSLLPVESDGDIDGEARPQSDREG